MDEHKLEKMIEFQLELQKKIYKTFDPSSMTYDQKVALTKEYVLYCHEELSEVMMAMKYKNYHKYEKEYREEDIRVEIVDCLKFILNLAIVWGMDAEILNATFVEKSMENLKRIQPNE